MHLGQKGMSVLWILIVVAVLVQLGMFGVQIFDYQFSGTERLQSRNSFRFLRQTLLFQLELDCAAHLKYLAAVPTAAVSPTDKFAIGVTLDTGTAMVKAGTSVVSFSSNPNFAFPNLAVTSLDVTKVIYRGVNGAGNFSFGGEIVVSTQSVAGNSVGGKHMASKDIGDVDIELDASGNVVDCSAL